jgi:hypothetical protein
VAEQREKQLSLAFRPSGDRALTPAKPTSVRAVEQSSLYPVGDEPGRGARPGDGCIGRQVVGGVLLLWLARHVYILHRFKAYVNVEWDDSPAIIARMTVSSITTSNHPAMLGRPIAFRLTEPERDRLVRLARLHDRTPGSEVRRAVRFYLANVEAVDRALREQAQVMS